MKSRQQFEFGGVVSLGLWLVVALMSGLTASAADLRSLEVVGVQALGSGQKGGGVPRQRAIEHALYEGVSRVALDLIAEYGPAVTDDSASDGNPGDGAANESENAWLLDALGKDMTPYTRRFRVVEDQGIRPALFSSERGAQTEYVVVVDVEVDVDRVLAKLQAQGLVRVAAQVSREEGLEVEINGLEYWSGYQAMVRLLSASTVGGHDLRPLEFSRGRVLLWVGVSGSSEQVLGRLLAAAPRDLQITPLDADADAGSGGPDSGGAGRLSLRVKWTPPAPKGP